jgi:hypothetical protein
MHYIFSFGNLLIQEFEMLQKIISYTLNGYAFYGSTLNTFSLFRILTFLYGSGSSDPYLCCALFEETKVPSTHADHVLQHRWVSLNYNRKIKSSLKFFLLSVILFRPVYIFINKHIHTVQSNPTHTYKCRKRESIYSVKVRNTNIYSASVTKSIHWTG